MATSQAFAAGTSVDDNYEEFVEEEKISELLEPTSINYDYSDNTLNKKSVSNTPLKKEKTTGPIGFKDFSSIVEFLLQNLPENNATCAVGKIKNIVRPEKYSSIDVQLENTGIVDHFSQALEENNSCFSATAYEFWKTIPYNTGSISAIATATKKNERAKLSEVAGQGRFKDLKPGWIWEKAMAATHNNPNAAMALLTLCMHDDIGTIYPVKISAKKWPSLLEKEKAALIKELALNERALAFAKQGSNAYRVLDYRISSAKQKIRELESTLENGPRDKSMKRELQCPAKHSMIYAARSLGAEVDIPGELKSRVAFLQRKSGDANTIPAKSYHFFGGAYIGCQLTQCGVSAPMATWVAKRLAKVYRTFHLLPKIESLISSQQSIADRFDIHSDSPNFPAQSGLKPQELAEMDAARLFRNWKLNSAEIDMAEDPMANPTSSLPAGRIPQGTLCEIPGWSVKRCEAARKVLQTWRVDFEWTSAQHEAGAQFAASKCQPQPMNEKMDEKICRAEKSKSEKYYNEGGASAKEDLATPGTVKKAD